MVVVLEVVEDLVVTVVGVMEYLVVVMEWLVVVISDIIFFLSTTPHSFVFSQIVITQMYSTGVSAAAAVYTHEKCRSSISDPTEVIYHSLFSILVTFLLLI